MADESPQPTLKDKNEIDKSAVRRRVTYMVVGAALLFAGAIIAVLLYAGKYDVATNIFGTVMTLASSIAGFWFGNRKAEQPT